MSDTKYLLIIQNGPQSGERYLLKEETTTIGRDLESAIQLADTAVSRHHACVTFKDEQATIEDLGSRNGTQVQGETIDKPTLLESDGIIRIGLNIHLRYIVSDKPLDEIKSKLPFKELQTENETLEMEAADLAEAAPAVVAEPATPVNGASKRESTIPVPGNGPAPYTLMITGGKQSGQMFPLVKGHHSIGRADDNEIQLHNLDISNHHAVIHVNEQGIWLQDLDSQNGTYANNKAVLGPTWLKPSDVLQIGATVLAEIEDGVPTGITKIETQPKRIKS